MADDDDKMLMNWCWTQTHLIWCSGSVFLSQ